jgi:phage recombination protein Bet
MNTEHTTTNQNQMVLSTSKIELIKRTIAKGATDDELELFMHLANKYNLDPFAKEVWFIKPGSGQPQIYTSRDGYLKIAHASGVFDGLESYTIDDEQGNPIKAVCKVYRKDMTRSFQAEIKVKEYNTKSPVWLKYPSAMAIKVAEVFALKRAFSISGFVTQEELPVSDSAQTGYLPPDTQARYLPLSAQTKTVERITDAQVKRLFAICKSTASGYPLPRWSNEGAKAYLGDLGYHSSKDILVSDYQDICDFFASNAEPSLANNPAEEE